MEPLRDPAFGDNGIETGWGRIVPGIRRKMVPGASFDGFIGSLRGE